MTVEVKVLGGGREVGRLSILVKKENNKAGIILDSGVNFDEEDKPVYASTYPPKHVRAIVLSHAHLDHIGTAPLYYISGNPPLYTTKPTMQMAQLMLEDFLKLNGYYSPYEHAEVSRMLESTIQVNYGDKTSIGEDIELEFYSSGHIPGSLFTVISIDGVRIGFTGDINTIETKLMKPAQLDKIGKLDVLITEATYGDSTHPPRDRSEKRLLEIVEETLKRGGTVLIPAFSIARGQEIMMVLASSNLDVPVAVDGMVRQVTEIFLENQSFINNPHLLRQAAEQYLFVKGWQDRHRVWRKPGVIIASAGMLKGGPSLYYLKRLGQSPENTIALVSFQAPGTPGRKILEEGLMPSGSEPVRARVEWLDFSSHADQKGLLEIAEKTKPEKIIIVHSEPDTGEALAAKLGEKLGIEDIMIAENEQTIKIKTK